MSIEAIAGIVAATFVGLVVGLFVYVRIPKRLKQRKFTTQWRELQMLCKDKSSWPQALVAADKLLDQTLRRRKFKGKSMGERLVSAQKLLSNNDAVWFAHNLYKKTIADPGLKLKEQDVKTALVGFRQALRDLGALPDGDNKKS